VPDRATVACPDGHAIMTTVRGRSTTCPQCGRRVYVRADGTTRHGQAAEPGPSSGAPWTRRDQPRSAPARWGRRYDTPLETGDGPGQVDTAEYDADADRTRLYGARGAYLGWTPGNPFELVG